MKNVILLGIFTCLLAMALPSFAADGRTPAEALKSLPSLSGTKSTGIESETNVITDSCPQGGSCSGSCTVTYVYTDPYTGKTWRTTWQGTCQATGGCNCTNLKTPGLTDAL